MTVFIAWLRTMPFCPEDSPMMIGLFDSYDNAVQHARNAWKNDQEADVIAYNVNDGRLPNDDKALGHHVWAKDFSGEEMDLRIETFLAS